MTFMPSAVRSNASLRARSVTRRCRWPQRTSAGAAPAEGNPASGAAEGGGGGRSRRSAGQREEDGRAGRGGEIDLAGGGVAHPEAEWARVALHAAGEIGDAEVDGGDWARGNHAGEPDRAVTVRRDGRRGRAGRLFPGANRAEGIADAGEGEAGEFGFPADLHPGAGAFEDGVDFGAAAARGVGAKCARPCVGCGATARETARREILAGGRAKPPVTPVCAVPIRAGTRAGRRRRMTSGFVATLAAIAPDGTAAHGRSARQPGRYTLTAKRSFPAMI